MQAPLRTVTSSIVFLGLVGVFIACSDSNGEPSGGEGGGNAGQPSGPAGSSNSPLDAGSGGEVHGGVSGAPSSGVAGRASSPPRACAIEAPRSCPEPAPTYADVAPIFESRCAVCHGGMPNGPWPLNTYGHIATWRDTVRAALLGCQMPPADSGLEIPDDESLQILTWIRCGMPF